MEDLLNNSVSQARIKQKCSFRYCYARNLNSSLKDKYLKFNSSNEKIPNFRSRSNFELYK